MRCFAASDAALQHHLLPRCSDRRATLAASSGRTSANNAAAAGAFGAILLSTFFGTGSTFLAIAIFEKNKEITEQYNKSFYHVGGLIGGFITIVFLTLMLIFPNNFNFIAIMFSILCILGTIERIYYGYNILR